jgi:hypothetical protein
MAIARAGRAGVAARGAGRPACRPIAALAVFSHAKTRPPTRRTAAAALAPARAFRPWAVPGLTRFLVPKAFRDRGPKKPAAAAGSTGGADALASAEHDDDASTPPLSVADAVRAGSPLGVGFAAGGLLFPYLSGAAFELVDAGLVDPDTSPLAGASAGALIAACVGSGMSRADVDAACDALAADCRSGGTRGRLGSVLRDFLHAHLPGDAADRLRGRVGVAVTRLGAAAAARATTPGTPGLARPSSSATPAAAWAERFLRARLPSPAGLLISDFEGRDDLISALLTSCHIPLWMDGRLARTFRGEAHLDGGLTQFLPLPPAAGRAAVGVCAFPSRRTLLPAMGPDRLIAPDTLDEAWDVGLPTLLSWAFHPAGEADLSALAAKGAADAAGWAAASGVAAALADVRAAGFVPSPDRPAPARAAGEAAAVVAAAEAQATAERVPDGRPAVVVGGGGGGGAQKEGGVRD